LDNTLEAEIRGLTHVQVLILKDFALRLDATDTNDFYEIISERQPRGSTSMTANWEPAEWLTMMSDALLAQSAVDRLTSTAHTLVIEGSSYRQRDHHQRAAPDVDRGGPCDSLAHFQVVACSCQRSGPITLASDNEGIVCRRRVRQGRRHRVDALIVDTPQAARRGGAETGATCARLAAGISIIVKRLVPASHIGDQWPSERVHSPLAVERPSTQLGVGGRTPSPPQHRGRSSSAQL
jgi:hypothetical protein